MTASTVHGMNNIKFHFYSLYITNFTHISFSCMFMSILYVFRVAMCPSSGELIVSIRHLLYEVCPKSNESYLKQIFYWTYMQLQFIPSKVGFLWSNTSIPALLPLFIAVEKVFTWDVVLSPRRNCLDVFNCHKMVSFEVGFELGE